MRHSAWSVLNHMESVVGIQKSVDQFGGFERANPANCTAILRTSPSA
jgi:hypothetical protein